MLHVNAVLFVVLLEVAGAAVLGLIVWMVLAVRRRARDRRAADALVASVQAAETERSAALRELLEATGVEGDALDERVGAFARGERLLYKTLIDTYLARDSAALGRFDTTVSEALAPYRTLLAAQSGDTGEDDAGSADAASAARVSELEARNAKLLDELEITKQTIGNMLTEYAQIYERGDGAVGASTAGRILSGDTTADDPARGGAAQPETVDAAETDELLAFDGAFDDTELGEDDDLELGDDAGPPDDARAA